MTSIKTTDAQAGLGGIFRGDVTNFAGGNDKVSNDEARNLRPFLRAAHQELRRENPGQDIKIDQIVDRGMQKAMAVWGRFNVPGTPAGRYLSLADVRKIAEADPDLGLATKAAYAVALGADRSAEILKAVKSLIETKRDIGAVFRLPKGIGTLFKAKPGEDGRASLPANVLKGFDAILPAEQNDWAGVKARSFKLEGETIYVVSMFGEGDHAYLELFDKNGGALASARFLGDNFSRWDETFGMGRFTGQLGIYAGTRTEGLSDDAERVTAGQILSTWRPAVTVDRGTFTHDNNSITAFSTDVALSVEQRELARSALELLMPRTLEARMLGRDTPIDLAPQGQLRIGAHTDQRDGQRYLVVDWKDIDDASRTFYFQRGTDGVLELKIDQVNG
jgi:hypothetical protein